MPCSSVWRVATGPSSARIKARAQPNMRSSARLARLLLELETVGGASVESQSVLWEHEDNVTWLDKKKQRTIDVYVVVRHFKRSKLGTHVRWAKSDGQVREYRMPLGSTPDEHIGLYVYNPGENKNGELCFVCGGGEVVVEEDTCTLVHTIPLAGIQQDVTVDVKENSGYGLQIHFYFGNQTRELFIPKVRELNWPDAI